MKRYEAFHSALGGTTDLSCSGGPDEPAPAGEYVWAGEAEAEIETLKSVIETTEIEAKGRIALARQSVVAQDHKIDEQAETIRRLRETLRMVRIGCPTAELEATQRYGEHWRNELINATLSDTEEV